VDAFDAWLISDGPPLAGTDVSVACADLIALHSFDATAVKGGSVPAERGPREGSSPTLGVAGPFAAAALLPCTAAIAAAAKAELVEVS